MLFCLWCIDTEVLRKSPRNSWGNFSTASWESQRSTNHMNDATITGVSQLHIWRTSPEIALNMSEHSTGTWWSIVNPGDVYRCSSFHHFTVRCQQPERWVCFTFASSLRWDFSRTMAFGDRRWSVEWPNQLKVEYEMIWIIKCKEKGDLWYFKSLSRTSGGRFTLLLRKWPYI